MNNSNAYTKIADVYETSDYSVFKTLYGNRQVRASNVNALKLSMNQNGWVGGPVIVNEKMEIVDGQNRKDAAVATKTPIQFIIRPGYGIQQCVLLNKNSAPWNTTDYTQSWANQGYDSYKWLLEIKDKYPCFSLDDLSALCYNKGRSVQQSSKIRDYFRDGKLELTDVEKAQIESVVNWLSKFDEWVKKIKGRKFILYNAILFCYYSDTVDNDKLYEKVFVNNYHKINVSVGIQDYLKQIEAIYNAKLRNPSGLIHIERDFLDSKISTQEYD